MSMTVSTKKISKQGGLFNYMEELADYCLNDLLTEYKGQRFSDTSLQDIKALALNRLWPMYTTTPAGRNFLKKIVTEDDVENDVVRELRVAIDKVRQNPRG